MFFNSETGESEIIAKDFLDWVNVLFNELDYYTGNSLIIEKLKLGERLYPIKPFVIGGEYKIENLFNLIYPKYIEAYANIARQIIDLPDGATIKILTVK